MSRTITYLSVAALMAALYGCGAPPPPPATAIGHEDQAHTSHTNRQDHGMTDMDKMKAELAKLSPADVASAEMQHVCPVSGEMLGLMGPPIKLDLNGRQVWICCDACREQLLASPEKYLAKLKS